MPNSAVLEPDIEFDLESALEDDEHAHALPFCPRHREKKFFPITGTIVQFLCGRILRVKAFKDKPPNPCEECANFHGKTNCYVCGAELLA